MPAAIPRSSQAARLPLQFLGAHAPWALEGRASPAERKVLQRLVPSDEKSLGTTRRSSLHIWKVRRRRIPVAGIVDAGSQHPTGITDPGYKKKRREDFHLPALPYGLTLQRKTANYGRSIFIVEQC